MNVTRLVSFVLAYMLFATARSAPGEKEINIGDSRENVITALGKPKGVMKSGGSEYLSYRRGIVRITDGRVTMIKLDSPEEAARKESERLTIETERQLAQHADAQARENRMREGNDLKESKLNDGEFKELPDEEKLKFWKDFQTQYPGVDVEKEITALQKDTEPAAATEEKPEISEREQLLETINVKQEELDALVQKARTTSAGRTFRSHYLKEKQRLENEISEARAKLKALPAEDKK